MIENLDPNKRYYTIGEVAELFDVSKSLIRFWENEFDHLRPHKNSKGERRFTQKNLEQLQLIYHLVREKGFTLAGAKQEIQEKKKYHENRQEVMERLERIRDFLTGLRDGLEAGGPSQSEEKREEEE